MSKTNKNDAVVGNVRRLRAEVREFKRVTKRALKALHRRVSQAERVADFWRGAR
jgi:hypothetical protein